MLTVSDDDEDDDDDDLLTRGMIMGLIAWNIAITLILLIVVIAIISVCVDLGSRRRYDYQSECGFAGPNDGLASGPGSVIGHPPPQMREIRDNESDCYKIGSIGESLDSVRF